MYIPPKNDLSYSMERLDRIMRRQRLKFNPYTVSNKRLLEIVHSGEWGGEWDIVDIVAVHFPQLHESNDYRIHDGIMMTVGKSPEEIFIPFSALQIPMTADDTIKQERSWIGKKPIRNIEDIEKMVGKTYFVSRRIRGTNIRGTSRSAYRMVRLTGNVSKDAMKIREAIIAAKIEMLERVLSNPECRHYLSCSSGFFDYGTRIRQAIRLIKRFPDIQPPLDS